MLLPLSSLLAKSPPPHPSKPRRASRQLPAHDARRRAARGSRVAPTRLSSHRKAGAPQRASRGSLAGGPRTLPMPIPSTAAADPLSLRRRCAAASAPSPLPRSMSSVHTTAALFHATGSADAGASLPVPPTRCCCSPPPPAPSLACVVACRPRGVVRAHGAGARSPSRLPPWRARAPRNARARRVCTGAGRRRRPGRGGAPGCVSGRAHPSPRVSQPARELAI